MKRIKVTNWKGKEVEGVWNEKFYSAQVEDNPEGLYRIYIDNERVHITEEEKERLINEASSSKIEEDNKRISLIKREFEKLDKEAQKAVAEYFNLMIL